MQGNYYGLQAYRKDEHQRLSSPYNIPQQDAIWIPLGEVRQRAIMAS